MRTSSSPVSSATDEVDPAPRALLALALIVPAPSLGVIAAMVLWPGSTGAAIFFFLCKVWMLALPVLWRVFIDRRPLSFSPIRSGGVIVGAVLGVAISGVVLLSYQLLGESWVDDDYVREMATNNGIGTPALFLGAVVYWVLVNSVLEEYVYRWFIYEKCGVVMPPMAAVLASAACFTVHHVIAIRMQFDWNVTVLASIGVFVGGAVWSWLYLRYRSIWPGYISHAIVDIAVFWVGWRIIFG